jgi:hypothetical protein
VLEDVIDGHVTPESAVATYGVAPALVDEALRSWR